MKKRNCSNSNNDSLPEPAGMLSVLPSAAYEIIKVNVIMERPEPLILPDGTRVNSFFHLFVDYHRPLGGLCHFEQHRECHALFYYAVTAREMYEAYVLQQAIQYEGDPSVNPMFRRHFEHVANLYMVHATAMAQHWPCIVMQSNLCNIPVLPDEERYRFNTPYQVN